MTTAVAPTIPKTLFLFSGLDDTEKAALLQGGRMRRYAADDNLFLLGDPVQAFYVICDGAIQLFRMTPDGHEMTAEIFLAGDTIGETEILQHAPTHTFNARSVKASAVMEFPFAWLRDNLKRHHALALNLLAQLSRRNAVATMESEHQATMTAAQQVACFLERFCMLHDHDPHGFELPYSKTLIASRLGMELETLSRALAKIRDHGIEVQGTRVTFTDPKKMAAFACRDCSLVGNCPEHRMLEHKFMATQARRSQ